MREAIWLFLWMVDRTTREKLGDDGKKVGIVAGGHPVTDHEISKKFDCSLRTVKRWRNLLKAEGYIKMENTGHGYCYTVLNSKKWQKSNGPIKSVIRTLQPQAATAVGR